MAPAQLLQGEENQPTSNPNVQVQLASPNTLAGFTANAFADFIYRAIQEQQPKLRPLFDNFWVNLENGNLGVEAIQMRFYLSPQEEKEKTYTYQQWADIINVYCFILNQQRAPKDLVINSDVEKFGEFLQQRIINAQEIPSFILPPNLFVHLSYPTIAVARILAAYTKLTLRTRRGFRVANSAAQSLILENTPATANTTDVLAAAKLRQVTALACDVVDKQKSLEALREYCQENGPFHAKRDLHDFIDYLNRCPVMRNASLRFLNLSRNGFIHFLYQIKDQQVYLEILNGAPTTILNGEAQVSEKIALQKLHKPGVVTGKEEFDDFYSLQRISVTINQKGDFFDHAEAQYPQELAALFIPFLLHYFDRKIIDNQIIPYLAKWQRPAKQPLPIDFIDAEPTQTQNLNPSAAVPAL